MTFPPGPTQWLDRRAVSEGCSPKLFVDLSGKAGTGSTFRAPCQPDLMNTHVPLNRFGRAVPGSLLVSRRVARIELAAHPNAIINIMVQIPWGAVNHDTKTTTAYMNVPKKPSLVATVG